MIASLKARQPTQLLAHTLLTSPIRRIPESIVIVQGKQIMAEIPLSVQELLDWVSPVQRDTMTTSLKPLTAILQRVLILQILQTKQIQESIVIAPKKPTTVKMLL
jgi:hypothetical protein